MSSLQPFKIGQELGRVRIAQYTVTLSAHRHRNTFSPVSIELAQSSTQLLTRNPLCVFGISTRVRTVSIHVRSVDTAVAEYRGRFSRQMVPYGDIHNFRPLAAIHAEGASPIAFLSYDEPIHTHGPQISEPVAYIRVVRGR